MVENVLDRASEGGREPKARERRVDAGVEGETINCPQFAIVEGTKSMLDESDVVRDRCK